jgi:hypothetical protein
MSKSAPADPAVTPPPPLMLVMLPPDIAQQLYELMVKSDATLARDLAAIRRKYDRPPTARPSRKTAAFTANT